MSLIYNGKKLGSVTVVSGTVPIDQTATAEDIKLGKTASVNGVKVTGTLVPLDKAAVVKQIVDIKRSAKELFAAPTPWGDDKSLTNEMLQELLRFDTTSNATTIQSMFNGCAAIVSPPLFDTSKVTTAQALYYVCRRLKYPPLINLRGVASVSEMYYQCGVLEVIPAHDCRNVTNYYNWCVADGALREIWIKNIKANIQVSDGRTWGHLLTVESLIHLIRELRDTGSAKTLTMGATNLAKITGDNAVYVKVVEVTDEMREQDDLIDEKLPFELCESTDEGAILITEYTQLKNWQLA